jgi:hypothetical protein
MYLIRYELMVGKSHHYAPSATAGLRLIREIKASGGRAVGIMRTRDSKRISLADLEAFAAAEIGPAEIGPTPRTPTLRRLLGRRKKAAPEG